MSRSSIRCMFLFVRGLPPASFSRRNMATEVAMSAGVCRVLAPAATRSPTTTSTTSTAGSSAAALTALAAAVAAHGGRGEGVCLRAGAGVHTDDFADDDLGPVLDSVRMDFGVGAVGEAGHDRHGADVLAVLDPDV